ncbi:MAG: transglutaminase-like domain-containing protein [Nanoarchaeota archaeon]
MGRIILQENQAYIALPKEDAYLYVNLKRSDSFRLNPKLEYRLERIAARGVEAQGYSKDTYLGESRTLLLVAHQFYRGEVNPNFIQANTRGEEGHLGDEWGINVSSEAVRTTAREILKQLPPKQRDNPYAKIEVIMGWIGDNIKYTLVPPFIIDKVKLAIDLLPWGQKYDAFKIIESSFNFKEEELRVITADVHLSREVTDSRKIARELMNKVGGKDPVFGFLWLLDQNLVNDADAPILSNALEHNSSASATIEHREGKCVGIANAYIALARALKVPSRTLGGYITDGTSGGRHAWAASYLPPYGWVEVDPTHGQFVNFDPEMHAYEFSYACQNYPEFIMMEPGKNVPSEKIDEIRELLEEDN